MPGDRRSDCSSRMEPIGLTLKNIRLSAYSGSASGEIMLVHYCLACGKLSCNRVAGDDNAYSVISLLDSADTLESDLNSRLAEMNITLLRPADKQMVARALMGTQSSLLLDP